MMSKPRNSGPNSTVHAVWVCGVLALQSVAAFALADSARAGSCPSQAAGSILSAFCGVSAPVMPESVVVAQAGGVPHLEFAQGCRDSARGDAAFLNTCMRDEESARQKLTGEWEAFPHGDRAQCTALARLGGGGLQSYVELITCLELAKVARGLPKSAKE